jgi:hypothetical protein
MGMDVYGNLPRNKTGEYLRHSVWSWHPLADLVLDLEPEIAACCQYWHSNDGDGLQATEAELLAARLRARIANGEIAQYVTERQAYLDALPDEVCEGCQGTGTRTKPVPGDPTWKPTPGVCNYCSNEPRKGYRRPFATHYSTSVADVEELCAFLESCGGFKIH